jgi:hypothetical protein
MCSDLPFYYFTLNERFRDEEMPSFDLMPEDKRENDNDVQHHPLRLHRLRINQREDNSIMVPGRAMLPVRNKASIRQRLHKPEMGLPPVPMHLAFEEKT